MPNYVIEQEVSDPDNMSARDLEATSKSLGPDIHWVGSYVTVDKAYGVYVSPDAEKIRALGSIFEIKKVLEPKTKGFWKRLKQKLGLIKKDPSYTKKIFVPASSRELLRGWLIHCHKGRQRHDQAARQLEHRRNWLGAFAAVLAAVVGGSVFAALEQGASRGWKLTLAMISILSAVLASLSTFLNLAERAEKHRTAGVQYKAIIRELERRLTDKLHDDAGVSADSEVKKLEKQLNENLENRLNELEENSPIVPLRLFKKVDDEWAERGTETITEAESFYRP